MALRRRFFSTAVVVVVLQYHLTVGTWLRLYCSCGSSTAVIVVLVDCRHLIEAVFFSFEAQVGDAVGHVHALRRRVVGAGRRVGRHRTIGSTPPAQVLIGSRGWPGDDGRFHSDVSAEGLEQRGVFTRQHGPLVSAELRPAVLEPDLDSGLGQVDAAGQVLPYEGVWVVCAFKDSL